MPIRSLKDVNDAFADGRSHTQRFLKNPSTTGDSHWIDWAFASGQPAYDARVGVGLSFNPFVAQKNDAIYFPDIPTGMDRHLVHIELETVANGTGQTICTFYMYDLLGVYPLIDGDSTDEQLLDNTLTLPRYANGLGVQVVIVNHVAPMLTSANGTMSYTNSDGVDKSVAIRVNNTGQNKIVSSLAGPGGLGAIAIPLADGDKGVRKINSITFTTPPGGLYSMYLIQPIVTLSNNNGSSSSTKIWTEKNLAIHNAWNMPRIYDGAHLGFFFMPVGGSRTVSIFGNSTFVWG